MYIEGKTDIGSVREENQDALGHVRLDGGVFLAVADGMGGYAGGSLAAKLAIESLVGYVESHWKKTQDPMALLRNAIQEANRVVRERASVEEKFHDMGTTCVCCLSTDTEYYVAHVGDSRAYLLRDEVFSLLTEDHTVIQELIKQGRVKPLEASYHPSAGILMRCLGQIDDVEPDVSAPSELQEGDRILLCSDGLTGMVYEDEIAQTLTGQDLPATLNALIRMANEAGGFDNITVSVLQAGDFPEEASHWDVLVDSPEGLALMEAEGRLPADIGQQPNLRHTTVLKAVSDEEVEEAGRDVSRNVEWNPRKDRLVHLLLAGSLIAILAAFLTYWFMKH
ncbi:MAG: Stp1/IreP family PP2C-type Ser/Thr phosphatase [Deltaproteobacteria bacterium]|nr:Stp1/IreP family PP2C-type Ser/Thr phosphatase [Deltaproteobacteria bacterium]